MARKIDFGKAPWQGQLFCFLQGPIGKAIVEGDEFLKSQLGKTIWYDEKTGVYQGSNNRIATRLDSRVREVSSGLIKVVNLQDTNNPALLEMIKDRHYVSVPEVYLFSSNGEVAEQIKQIAVDKRVSFDTPCRATGLDFVAGGYAGRDDFALVQNEALDFKNNQRRFTEMKDGFPVFDDEKGLYSWYVSKNGSAGVCRGGGLNAVGDVANFVCSGRYGRVVLTTAEGGSPQIFADFVRKLQERFDAGREKLQKVYDEIVGNK